VYGIQRTTLGRYTFHRTYFLLTLTSLTDLFALPHLIFYVFLLPPRLSVEKLSGSQLLRFGTLFHKVLGYHYLLCCEGSKATCNHSQDQHRRPMKKTLTKLLLVNTNASWTFHTTSSLIRRFADKIATASTNAFIWRHVREMSCQQTGLSAKRPDTITSWVIT